MDLDDLEEEQEGAPWSIGRRVAFRFLAAYAVLYVFPFPLDLIPGIDAIATLPQRGWDQLAWWIGAHVLHRPVPILQTGSGDTLAQWIRFVVSLGLAALITIAWGMIDRRAWNHDRLREGLRVILRYYLAFVMISYGLAKVFLTQFVPPDAELLAQPLGELSPMRLLWSFMGFSPRYTIATGVVECVGGGLLLWRRTTTLGGLISAAAMANVLALNLCYDVPVKLLSAHLLAASLYMASPDLGRLLDVLVLGRATTAPPPPPPLLPVVPALAWVRYLLVPLKLLAITAVIWLQVQGQREARREMLELTREPLEDLWVVERFELVTLPGATPPPVPDPVRWRRLVVGSQGFGKLRFGDDRMVRISLERDPAGPLIVKGSDGPLATVTASEPEPNVLVLLGSVRGVAEDTRITLRRRPRHELPLLARGFHWVSEFPN